jgi:hypothetical protein
VDEHSGLLLPGEHLGGEADRRRPYCGPLPQPVILHGRVRDPAGAEGRPLGRQIPGPAHLRPRPAVDDVSHALLSQACHQRGRRHTADRDALAADPVQRGTGSIRPGQPQARA